MEEEKNTVTEVEETTVETTEEVVEPKEEVIEEKVEEPKKEEKKEKQKKDREIKKIISRIVNILLWIVLLGWMALVVTDYIHVHNEEKPQFCWFNEKTTDYSDGSVSECTGLGYKVINYDRSSFKAIEFGPFWIKDRTAEDNK